jgi:uncharacterized protein (DUF433 family)
MNPQPRRGDSSLRLDPVTRPGPHSVAPLGLWDLFLTPIPGACAPGYMPEPRWARSKLPTQMFLEAEAPPLRRDETGALRVGRSRVLLELVIHAFQDGATPESIAQRYPTATLPDIYAVVAYYLRHRGGVEAYLAEREQRATEVRQRIESHQGDLADLRGRLLTPPEGWLIAVAQYVL